MQKVTDAIVYSYMKYMMFDPIAVQGVSAMSIDSNVQRQWRARSDAFLNEVVTGKWHESILVDLIQGIDDAAMSHYKETCLSCSAVLSHKQYVNSMTLLDLMKGKFREETLALTNEERTYFDNYYRNIDVKPADYPDHKIIDDAYGYQIAKLKAEQDRRVMRGGGESQYKGNESSYGPVNRIYRHWLDASDNLDSKYKPSIAIANKVYALNSLVIGVLDPLKDLIPSKWPKQVTESTMLRSLLLLRIHLISNTILQIRVDQKNYASETEDIFYKEMMSAYQQAINGLQQELGLIQQIVYFDQQAGQILGAGEKSTMALLPELSTIFSLAKDEVTTGTELVGVIQKRMGSTIDTLVKQLTTKTLTKVEKRGLQFITQQFEPSCFEDEQPFKELIDDLKGINDLIKKLNQREKNATASQSYLPSLSFFSSDEEFSATFQPLHKQVQSLLFDATITYAIVQFTSGKSSAKELLANLKNLAKEYQKVLPNRAAGLDKFCHQLETQANSNQELLDKMVKESTGESKLASDLAGFFTIYKLSQLMGEAAKAELGPTVMTGITPVQK